VRGLDELVGEAMLAEQEVEKTVGMRARAGDEVVRGEG